MNSQCLKFCLNNQKIFIHVIGIPLQELQGQITLVYEMVKAIGKSEGLSSLQNPGDIHSVDICSEPPDYFVYLKEGVIKIINPI